jgi:ring-1,2-phenylacetyl-CoA epoxidase subunit PaaC
MSTDVTNEASRATDLTPAVQDAVRDLILVMADSKRLLGMRYGQWILGAPELEAGIACASMAQDEWGHGRLLYALLRDFGEDVDGIEHGRDASEYCSMDALDAEPAAWPELVAVNAFIDTALTIQLEALSGSAYLPLRQRVQKLLEEETFHAAHGTHGSAASPAPEKQAMTQCTALPSTCCPPCSAGSGPDSARGRTLHDASIVDASGSGLRNRFLQRVAPLLRLVGDHSSLLELEPGFDGFDERTRRGTGSVPTNAPSNRSAATGTALSCWIDDGPAELARRGRLRSSGERELPVLQTR